MKKHHSLLLILLVMVFCACNKEPEKNAAPTIGLRVKSDGFYTYEYDDKGRLKMLTTSNGITKFYHADSAVTEVVHFLNGSVSGILIHKLRANGLVYLSQDAGAALNWYSKFEFSAAKKIELQVDTFLVGGGTQKFVYYRSGEKTDSIREIVGNISFTRSFEYYLDKLNTVNNESTGKAWLGVSDRYPVKKVTVRNGNNSVVTASYVYEYDAQNRISKRTVTRPNAQVEERVISYY